MMSKELKRDCRSIGRIQPVPHPFTRKLAISSQDISFFTSFFWAWAYRSPTKQKIKIRKFTYRPPSLAKDFQVEDKFLSVDDGNGRKYEVKPRREVTETKDWRGRRGTDFGRGRCFTSRAGTRWRTRLTKAFSCSFRCVQIAEPGIWRPSNVLQSDSCQLPVLSLGVQWTGCIMKF